MNTEQAVISVFNLCSSFDMTLGSCFTALWRIGESLGVCGVEDSFSAPTVVTDWQSCVGLDEYKPDPNALPLQCEQDK